MLASTLHHGPFDWTVIFDAGRARLSLTLGAPRFTIAALTHGDRLDDSLLEPFSSQVLRGTAVSAGVGHGAAYVLACVDRVAAARRDIAPDAIEAEVSRFEQALDRAVGDLLALKQEVSHRIGPSEAEIFAAQALMLSDAAFRNQISGLIRHKQVNAESALSEVIEKFSHAFDQIPDAYLRERAGDVRDVGRRVLSALIEEQGSVGLDVPEGAIVVADELPPSITARLDLARIRGLVTARGGKFSHTSILARSQGVAAVTGILEAPLRIKTGDTVVVDAFTGAVFIKPTLSVQREYERVEGDIRADKERLQQLVPLRAVTLDGAAIGLSANVSKFADTEAALLHNADGIGLYRTEFAYAIRNRFPTEDEQYEFLSRAAERFHPRPVVFRLLDLGGDKELPYLPLPVSRNPALAQRGIRLLLRYPDVLRRQLRAFLRVSAKHSVSILMPVVSGLPEVRQTRAVLRDVQAQLRAEGQAFNPKVPLGAMIEVPSAVLLARSLAKEVDFFSLGTNDLVQYVLAADREDESVAPYYQPAHPAVLSMINSLVDAARVAEKSLSICGDMAGEPTYTELLLGLGLRNFSVPAGEILDVKNRIRNTHLAEARKLAMRALELGSAEEVEALLEARQRKTEA